ncbi:MAG: SBBP repeat-containing protein [Bacteroidetes bacterium]|nr:SBBP repeat-containing protein [Bacteroidota bacterium]
MKKFYYIPVFVILISGNVVANGNSDKRTPSEKEKSQLSQNLRGSGLCFTPNKGQLADMNGKLCPDILYKGSGGGADIYLRTTGLSYVYSNMAEVMHEVDEQVEKLIQAGAITEADERKSKEELMQKENIKVHRVDMDFANCNENIEQLNENEVEGYNNYYYAHCPNGVLNVKQYNKVTYKNIYKGIDITYYGNTEKGIKYDLIVQPHADPNQIKLHWTGAESIHINRQGNLVIKTSVNEFTESIPKVYQIINGKIVDVKAEYKLTLSPSGRAGEGFISFSFSTFNSSFPLVVDPWATYYGGTGFDYCRSVACDNTGNVYLVGYTQSPSGIASLGFQTVFGGSLVDAFLVKFNALNGARIWATYYGGTGDDKGHSVACDNAGNMYLAGETTSKNPGVMAIAPGFQTVFGGGGNDAFLVKFDAAGVRDWATYYGGTGGEQGYSAACDNAGNIYLAGYTTSPNAIATATGHQPFFAASIDAYLVKFDPAGMRDWATYYGGTGADYGNSVACDNAGNVYLAGLTASPNAGSAIATAGAHQTVFGGGQDAFLVKFDAAGVRGWATYYGGTGWDRGYSVACDNTGNVYLAGNTSSPNTLLNVIASPGGFQTVFGGGFNDAFLVKFNSAGGRIWGTYYGSNLQEEVPYGCLAIDGNNNVYLYMEVEDEPGPTLIDPCAYQPNYAGGGEDQMIVKFNPAGQKLCATYFGGTGYEDLDLGGGIAVSGNLLFICASNLTGGYPVTPGAHQTVHGGGGAYDAVLACLCTSICEGKTLGLNYTATVTSVCANAPVTFTPTISKSCDTTGYKYHWVFTGGNPATSDFVKPTVSFSGAGTHDVKLVVTTLCKKDSVIKPSYITVNNCGCALSSAVVSTGNTSCSTKSDGSAAITISNGSGGPYTYNWSNGITGTTTGTAFLVNGLSASTYTVTITEGACTSTANVTIGSPPPIAGQFTKGAANCAGCGCKEWLMVNATGGASPYTYTWPDGYVNRYKNQLCPGTYTINIKDKNGCSVNVNLSVP